MTTFLSAELKRVLSDCAFNEVHLVNRDSDGLEMVRPLRALAMLEAAYVFMEAVKSVVGENVEFFEEDAHMLFIAACHRHRMSLDFVAAEDVRAQFGGVSVQFVDSGIRIRDCSDFAPAAPSERPDVDLDPVTIAQILNAYDGFVATHSFSCAVGMPRFRGFATRLPDSVRGPRTDVKLLSPD